MVSLNLLNTTIVTNAGLYRNDKITVEEAVVLAAQATKARIPITSWVGHEATAQAMGTILGLDVPVSRGQFSQEVGQVALCLKIRGRLPEGTVLTMAELNEIGYDFWTIKRYE